jgi:hypothetical protein
VQVSIFCSVDFAFFVLPTSRKPDDDYSVLSGVERSCYAFATCPSPYELDWAGAAGVDNGCDWILIFRRCKHCATVFSSRVLEEWIAR